MPRVRPLVTRIALVLRPGFERGSIANESLRGRSRFDQTRVANDPLDHLPTARIPDPTRIVRTADALRAGRFFFALVRDEPRHVGFHRLRERCYLEVAGVHRDQDLVDLFAGATVAKFPV